MAGARTAIDQSGLHSRLRSPASARPRVARHNYASDIVTPRKPSKYIQVRAGAKSAGPAKRRASSVPVPSLPRQSKSRVLRREAVRRNRQRRRRQLSLKRFALTAMAVLMLVAGGVMSYDGWRANRMVAAQAAQLQRDANIADKAANHSPSASAAVQTSSTNPAPATDKPSVSDIASYVVAPTMPRYLVIPKLNVKARVRQLGLASDGSVATPSNVFDTGWYKGSALPGTPGAALIDGHISSWTTTGVFYGLKDLKSGDQMQVIRGDGTIITYQVVKTQTYSDANTDMGAALAPVVPGTPGLNLISCYGKVKPGTSEFDQRIVVFTKQVSVTKG